MEVEDRLPRPAPHEHEYAIVVELRGLRRVSDEAEHPTGLLLRKLADLLEGVDVPLGQDEQVRLGHRLDVADRDEAVSGQHVVAVGDQPAEEAALTRRRQGSSSETNCPRLHEVADGGVESHGV